MVFMDVSVIATVVNEGESIRRLLDSLLIQSRPPDEVVISDGGSTDNTIEVLERYQNELPLKIVESPESNISQGRNAAIAAANGPIIAVTDAGVVLSQDWLRELVRPYEESDASMVGGWFEADPYSDFEVAMGAAVLPSLPEIDPSKFLPSSRSVSFKKSDWKAVGGYPEWLDYSEDLVFDLELVKRNGPFHFSPKAVVYFRPRSTLRVYARQYYNYARGDGKANLWPKRHAIRYVTYLALLPLLLRLIWSGKWLGWVGLIVGAGVYCGRPAQRLWPMTRGWSLTSLLRAFSLIPIIRLVGDLAKMLGYPAGVLWRLSQGRSKR
jgi:glycosyltransferase involved in cell wall biosynthesis